MTDNIRRFELEIDSYVHKDIPDQVRYMKRILATAGLQGVVLRSPVRTGRFRMSWLVTEDGPTYDAPTDVGSIGEATSVALSRGLATINAANPFGTLYIQNNTEYGEDLEDGSSKQAPAGILAVTVADIERIFK